MVIYNLKNILYIDADKARIKYLLKYFNDNYFREYKVFSVDNCEDFFALLNKIKTDIIILEVLLPNINGWEIFDKLKANPLWKNIPIIIYTCRTDPFASHAGRTIADDFVLKSSSIEILKNSIDFVLKNN